MKIKRVVVVGWRTWRQESQCGDLRKGFQGIIAPEFIYEEDGEEKDQLGIKQLLLQIAEKKEEEKIKEKRERENNKERKERGRYNFRWKQWGLNFFPISEIHCFYEVKTRVHGKLSWTLLNLVLLNMKRRF